MMEKTKNVELMDMVEDQNENVILTTGEAIVEGEIVAKEDLMTDLNPAIFENPQQVMFSSIQGADRETAVKLFNAINGAENALGDHLGEVIEIQDMVAHVIELEDENSGEMVKAMRVVLLSPDGTGYHAISQGIASSMQKLIATIGQPPWVPAIKIVPVQQKTRKGYKTLTLRLQA